MIPPSDAIWNHPQYGGLSVRVIKKAPSHDAYIVQYEKDRKTVVALAQGRHLESLPRVTEEEFARLVEECPCSDPGDCQDCAA